MQYARLPSFNSETNSESSASSTAHEARGHNSLLGRTVRSRRRGLCLIAISAVAASALIAALLWVPDATIWDKTGLSHPKVLENEVAILKRCGQTPSEGSASGAKALGCVYDIVSGSWVFPECHDPELENEFLSGGPRWQWWADEGRTRELTLDEIRATGGGNPTGYFVTPEYHDYHCAYTWRKLHRAMQGSKLVDDHIGNMRHTNHCSGTMYRDHTQDPEVAHFDLIFSGCVKL
jgi:hypothetical protein